MPEETPNPKRSFPWIRAGLVVALVCIVIALILYLRSDALRERVRRQIVNELEATTGGSVDLKRFSWSFAHLQFELNDLTIHGLEKPGELPYAHIDRAFLALKVVSVLKREIAMHELDVDHPVVHLILYADGSTNQPLPKVRSSGRGVAQHILELQIDRLRAAHGLLVLNDRQVPFDVRADNVTAEMTYAGARQAGYRSTIQVGTLEMKRPGAPAVMSQAETNFTIHKNDIDISNLHWTQGTSRFEASGKITDLRNPRFEGQYRGSFELAALGELVGRPELRDGTAEIAGSGRYISSEDFFSSGKLTVRNVAYAASGLRLAQVDAISDYTIDVDRITLTKLNGGAFGGRFTGSGNLLHWVNLVPKTEVSRGKPRQKIVKAQEGSFEFNLSGIQLAQGFQAVLPPKSPANRLRLASIADGKLAIRWVGSPLFADASIDLNVQARSTPRPSELPLTGSVHATYHGRGDRIDVAGVNLAARATRLSATGSIGAESQMRVSLNTSDLSELTPVMQALGSEEGPLPAIVHGQASFNGTVKGKLAAPMLAGHLQATDFDTVISSGLMQFRSRLPSAPRNSAAGTHSIRWDSLAADVTYSPTSAAARNVTLKRARAQITGSETAGLIDGQLEPESPLEIHIAARNTDFSDLQLLAGSSYALTGSVTGQVTLKGTKENLSANGHAQITGGTVYGEPYHDLSADLKMLGQQASLDNIVFRQEGGSITGHLDYQFDSERFAFRVSGTNFDLANIAKLQTKKVSVGGRAEFTASGSGTIPEPDVNARISVNGLAFGGESAGNLVATAAAHGGNLHVEGHTSTQLASADMNGDVKLQGDLPAEIRLNLAKLDLDPLLRVYLAGKVTGHSAISGKFVLRGPLKRPRELTVTADVDEFTADIQHLKLQNDGPLRFSVGNEVATIQQFHIVGTDTDITANGKVELAGAQRLDLHGNGHLNMAILQTLNSNVTSSGEVTFTVNATGNLNQPSFAGNMQIANGAVAFVDLPNGLSEINGTLSFDLNRLRVQKLTAKTGGGDLTLGGYITYSNGIFFDLSGTGRDIRIRYPEGVSSQATADLRLVGGLSNSVLSGDVTVTKFGLTPQFDLAAYVQRAKQPPSPPSPNSPIDNVRLDVHITSTPELRVETSLARLSGDVDMRLRGTLARPSVLGRLSIAEGDITFNSTTYHLERGDIVFANPVRIEPVVNVEASARVRDYDITLGFHGTPDKLNVTYRSEPPLPSADIIALLAFGRTRQESEIQAEQGSQAASAQSFAQTASNAILGEALNSAVSSRVQKLFGISRIKIDPNLGGTEDNPNARLTIEQQISKNVTVTYLTNLGQYAEEVLQVEYNINKNISLVAVRDYTGVLAIDLRIRQRKR